MMRKKSEVLRPRWGRYAAVSGGLLVLLVATLPGIGADNAPVREPRSGWRKPTTNWRPNGPRPRSAKLVFDVAVTPHWLDSGDRFWYSFENTKGRKFYIVDPAKKTKTFVFDPVKLAASLTTATGLPYDSQHLPITAIRFVKGDASIQFEINVPRDAVIPGEKKRHRGCASPMPRSSSSRTTRN